MHEDFTHDTVGRPVTMPIVPEAVLRADIIEVRIVGGRKVYEPIPTRGMTPIPGDLKVVS